VKSDNLEIGGFLHLKSEIKNLKLDKPRQGSNRALRIVQFEISDFGFQMQESSDFEIVRFHNFPSITG
jgi:hypothetical protein